MIELQALTLRSSFPARNPELIVYPQSSLPVEKGRKGRRGKKKLRGQSLYETWVSGVAFSSMLWEEGGQVG